MQKNMRPIEAMATKLRATISHSNGDFNLLYWPTNIERVGLQTMSSHKLYRIPRLEVFTYLSIEIVQVFLQALFYDIQTSHMWQKFLHSTSKRSIHFAFRRVLNM